VQNEGSVQQARGLSGGKLSGNIQPGGRINGAVKRGIFNGQAAAKPDETYQENCAGQQLLRVREEGAGMTRDFRGEAAKRGGEHVGQSDHRQQSAGNFAAGCRERGRKRSTRSARRAEAPRPCGQATKRRGPKGGAEGRREGIEKREHWRPSGQRRKEENQHQESGKCGLAFPGNGRGLRRRKQKARRPLMTCRYALKNSIG